MHQQNNNQNINPKNNKYAVNNNIKDIDIESKNVSDLNKKSYLNNAYTPLICKNENNNHFNVKNEKYENLSDSVQKNTARHSNENSPKRKSQNKFIPIYFSLYCYSYIDFIIIYIYFY